MIPYGLSPLSVYLLCCCYNPVKYTDQHGSFLYAVILSLAMVIGGFLLSHSHSLKRLDFVLYDSLLPLQQITMSEQLVIVAIDDASIQELGRWPWSRRHHAQLLDRLTDMGARAVGFDVLFSETQKDDPQADVLFSQALQRNGRTVLPVAPMQLTPIDPISEMLPLAEFAVTAQALGHVDVELDIDGLCRRFFLYAGLGDSLWPAFALSILQAGNNLSEITSGNILNTSNSTGWLRQQSMLIPYAGHDEQAKTISYADVLSGRIMHSEIKDKYVLIGATATGLGDVISTPASRAHERMPGIVLNAHIISGLLQNIHRQELSQKSQGILTSVLIVLSTLLITILPLRFGLLSMLFAILMIATVSTSLFLFWQLWFPPTVALLMTASIWPLWSAWQLGVENRLRQNLLKRLENQALHHMATGLPNHYMLEDRLRLINKEQLPSSQIVALMVVHINWPGSASIVLDRPMGDHTLKLIGERVRAVVTGENFIAHLNGDDFAVLLTGIKDANEVKQASVNLLNELQKPLEEDNQHFLLAPQIGVSICQPEDDTVDLLGNAYAAMFKSRIDDTEHLCIYSADIGQQLRVRSQLEQALIYALERDEFEVYYQPQVNADTAQIVGFEALLRWHNPLLGTVGPESFIPIAEHVGLIKNIGTWVLKTACQQLQDWHNDGLGPLRLAVNVSPIQFIDPELHSTIDTAIKQSGISPGSLELEITESSLMYDVQSAVQVMRDIKQKDIELAIDDFGTGYSSLSSLRHYPLDRLKIDQSFTREIGKDNDATEITLSILAMAKHLKLRVIAEGVETIEQAEFLRFHGCDEFQGFLFSKAISSAELTHILRNKTDLSPFKNFSL